MPHGLQASLRFQGLQFGKSCFKRGLLRKLMSARFWLARRAPLPLTTPSIPVCSLSWSRLRFTGQKIPCTCPLFCLQNLTAGDWVSVGIWTALSCKLPICENQSTYFGGLAWKAKPTIRKLLFHWGPTVRWRSDSYSSSFLQARRPGMCVWGRISSWQALASSSFDRSVLAGLRKHVLEAFPGKAGWTLESSTSSWPTLDAGISWSSSRSLWLWVEMSMFIKYEIWDGSSKFNGQAAPIQTTLDPSKQPTRPIQTTITPGLPLQVRIVSHWRWSSES